MLPKGVRIATRPRNGRHAEASPDLLRKGKWKRMKKPARIPREDAEMLAVAALSFLAEEPERLGVFLSLTGIGPEAVRTAAGEPGFLAGVLEHILDNESLLLAFAASAGADPADIARARHALGRIWERDVP
jgi:hypothetical protein